MSHRSRKSMYLNRFLKKFDFEECSTAKKPRIDVAEIPCTGVQDSVAQVEDNHLQEFNNSQTITVDSRGNLSADFVGSYEEQSHQEPRCYISLWMTEIRTWKIYRKT